MMPCRRRYGLLITAALALPGEAWAVWGDNWGEMVWSSPAAAVPALPMAGLMLLALVLAAAAAWSLRQRSRALGTLLVLVAIPLVAIAGTISMPHTFVNGTAADADEINENFDVLVTESNAQDLRLNAVETAPVAHTHPGSEITSQVGDADTVGGMHAAELDDSAEIVSGIAAHAGNAAAHHAAYTDPNAVAAMGGIADTNPFHHARYSDLDATNAMGAIDDTNPLHHARFTHAEARMANQYGKTAVVALSSGDYEDPLSAMNALDVWCGIPSADNPCLLRIMPGIYDLGNQALVMQAYVDIQGSGENTAVLTSTNSGDTNDGTSATLVGADNAELRFLSVENQGGGSTAIGIYNASTSLKITHVTARASGGGGFNTGIWNEGGSVLGSSPILSNVTATASGGTRSTGVFTKNLSTTMRNVRASASGASSANVGVWIEGGDDPSLSNVTATASGGNASGGVFNISSSATMKNVRASASGATISNLGVFNDASSPTMEVVTATASGGTTSIGVKNDNSSSPQMTLVTATASDATTNYGVHNNGSSPVMKSVRASASGGTNTRGVFNEQSSPTMTRIDATASGGSEENQGIHNDGGAPIMRSITAAGSGGDNARGVQNSDSSASMTSVTATASGGSVSNYAVRNDSSSVHMALVRATASGGGEYNRGVSNLTHSSATMMEVVAEAWGASESNYGVYNLDHSTMSMMNVTATGTGGDNAYGIYNDELASAAMTNVTAMGSDATHHARGAKAWDGSTATIRNSNLLAYNGGNQTHSLSVSSNYVTPDTWAKVANTMLVGPTSAADPPTDPDEYTCIGVYDAAFTPLDANCQ